MLAVAKGRFALVADTVGVFIGVIGAAVFMAAGVTLGISVYIGVLIARNFNLGKAVCAKTVVVCIYVSLARSEFCSAIVAEKILINVKVSRACIFLVDTYGGVCKPRISSCRRNNDVDVLTVSDDYSFRTGNSVLVGNHNG